MLKYSLKYFVLKSNFSLKKSLKMVKEEEFGFQTRLSSTRLFLEHVLENLPLNLVQ